MIVLVLLFIAWVGLKNKSIYHEEEFMVGDFEENNSNSENSLEISLDTTPI